MEERHNRLEKLEKGLYSRVKKSKTVLKKYDLTKRKQKNKSDIKKDWSYDMPKKNNKKSRFSFSNIVLILALLFFLGSLSIAAFSLLGGGLFVSTENVEISFIGPVSIGGGDKLSVDIVVGNKNKTQLQNARMFIEYPDGTRRHDDITQELTREEFNFDDIDPGAISRKTIQAVLYGEKEKIQTINTRLEYSVEGSNAVVVKEKTYEILIDSSPIILNLEYDPQVTSGSTLDMKLSVTSNSNSTIEDLTILAEYPFGFSFLESEPSISFGDNVWNFDSLDPEETKEIRIRGVLEGQDNEERTFRFKAGTSVVDNEQEIEALFSAVSETLMIQKTALAFNVEMTDGSKDYVAKAGQILRMKLAWENNTGNKITNARIEATFGGNMFDKNGVIVGESGFYRSLSNTVIWDQNTEPRFREILPDEKGSVIIELNPLSQGISNFQKPIINVDAEMSGKVFSGQDSESISKVLSEEIRFLANTDLYSRGLYSSGPFKNSGPFPPQAEQETTYTVIWSITNMFNPVTRAEVVASLPPYVEWLNVVSNQNEKVVFDEENREIIWNVGDIPNGGLSVTKQVAFQVKLLPSVNQVGTVPVIVDNAVLRGIDTFTRKTIQDVEQVVTTKVSTDPIYQSGLEVVR